jgi:hypothetical protein
VLPPTGRKDHKPGGQARIWDTLNLPLRAPRLCETRSRPRQITRRPAASLVKVCQEWNAGKAAVSQSVTLLPRWDPSNSEPGKSSARWRP